MAFVPYSFNWVGRVASPGCLGVTKLIYVVNWRWLVPRWRLRVDDTLALQRLLEAVINIQSLRGRLHSKNCLSILAVEMWQSCRLPFILLDASISDSVKLDVGLVEDLLFLGCFITVVTLLINLNSFPRAYDNLRIGHLLLNVVLQHLDRLLKALLLVRGALARLFKDGIGRIFLALPLV